ncbi:uncharacterized protein EV420DRAFT_1229924, partial [Desarmillaria tabescens]
TCGTAGDATLSSCRDLLANGWSGLDYSRTCHYGLYELAYNPICSSNNCCIYVTVDNLSDDEVHDRANDILNACGAPNVDKVNGRNSFDTSTAVCVSDGSGCGDCL